MVKVRKRYMFLDRIYFYLTNGQQRRCWSCGRDKSMGTIYPDGEVSCYFCWRNS